MELYGNNWEDKDDHQVVWTLSTKIKQTVVLDNQAVSLSQTTDISLCTRLYVKNVRYIHKKYDKNSVLDVIELHDIIYTTTKKKLQ